MRRIDEYEGNKQDRFKQHLYNLHRDNFLSTLMHMRLIPLTHKTNLVGFMRKIFEVSLEAPPLCHMWVKLIKELLASHKQHSQEFLGVVLHEAQYRFSVGRSAQSALQSKIGLRNTALVRKARAMGGLCRFLGTLYANSLLPGAFIHECFKNLLRLSLIHI